MIYYMVRQFNSYQTTDGLIFKEAYCMRPDVVKKGEPAAPNRSLLYALGYTKEELERPLRGVVCS